MRIITWNIGEDEQNLGGKLTIDSYEYIIDTIKNEKVDVICLQEAIIKSDYIDSIAKYITENTDLKYSVEFELSDSHINIGCKMGVVICSKYEIKDVMVEFLTPKFCNVKSKDEVIGLVENNKNIMKSYRSAEGMYNAYNF